MVAVFFVINQISVGNRLIKNPNCTSLVQFGFNFFKPTLILQAQIFVLVVFDYFGIDYKINIFGDVSTMFGNAFQMFQ